MFRRLPSPIHPSPLAEIYNYKIESDGFYFVDHLVDAKTASVALRIFIDAALSSSQTVEIFRAMMKSEQADAPNSGMTNSQISIWRRSNRKRVLAVGLAISIGAALLFLFLVNLGDSDLPPYNPPFPGERAGWIVCSVILFDIASPRRRASA